MSGEAPFHKVRWHVPARSLGITLPPGYHLLEAPLQLFLCHGDQEVARFDPGVDPAEVQKAAEAHAARQAAPAPAEAAPEDTITGLPWSASLRGEAVRLARTADVHAMVVELAGLDTLMDVYGYKAAHSVLRQIARRLRRLVDERDRLSRHSGDAFLILTTRSLEDVRAQVDMIHQQVELAGLDTDGVRLPRSRIGIATVDRLAEADPLGAAAIIDAVIISAEAAASAAVPSPPVSSPVPEAPAPAEPEPPAEFPATAAPAPELQTHPPAAAAGPPHPVPEPPPAAPEPGGEPAPAAEVTELEEPSPEELPARVYEIGPEPTQPLPPQPPHPIPAAEPSTPAMPVPAPDGTGRIRLKGASLDVSGMVATATVKLALGEREVVGRAVGRNAQERRLFLAAEAAARAITEFLPPGYGVVIHDIQQAPPEVGKALWAVVLFLTPSGEESLLGIAPIDDMVFEAAGKAVLNAVNRRIAPLLSGSP
jgi:GGDEF domain-containing protein